jgi:hypothetical protein
MIAFLEQRLSEGMAERYGETPAKVNDRIWHAG